MNKKKFNLKNYMGEYGHKKIMNDGKLKLNRIKIILKEMDKD